MPRTGLLTSQVATVAADGMATITIVAPDIRWQITQISVELPTAPAGAVGELRHNGRFITAFLPAGDAIGGDPPLPLRPGDQAVLLWTGCTPGDQARATWFYDELAWDA